MRDIERSAEAWSDIAPGHPEVRAWMAKLLSEKYRFKASHVPATIAALGLEETDAARAFRTAFDAPLDSIYDTGFRPLQALGWRWSRLSAALESLPPFWTAFALTLTEIGGAGTLALPIALATIGPIAGLGILLFVGLINIVTVAYLAEASARNGTIVYGSAFIGKLVQDFLGPAASFVVRAALFLFCCSVLIAYYTGFSSTLSAFSGVPPYVWAVMMFAITAFAVLRRGLVGTLSSALLIGIINISILVILSLVALRHFDAQFFTAGRVPFVGADSFDPSPFQLIFGIVMAAYFGHVSVSNCAQAVLRREPDGRSLISGTVAAMIAAMAVYALWTVSIGSAISPERLKSEGGTALIPLAEVGGPTVQVLGTMFVVLALGMGSVHFSLGIFNIGREAFAASIRHRYGIANLIALGPLILIFAYVQWSFASGNASFIKPLELQGALLTPIIASLFPAMLIIAGRRRGQSVGRARLPRILANPLVASLIASLAIGSLVLHATLIWDDPLPRLLAAAATVICLSLVAKSWLRQDFRPGLYITLTQRSDATTPKIAVAANGQDVDASLSFSKAQLAFIMRGDL